ncbi:MAG: O-methyltransferase [Clostridia bacterium]|nr:O-methyltransferase [Clostridia bacterium]
MLDKKIIQEKLNNLKNYATINNVPILRLETSKILIEYVKTNNPKTILEIGTAVGYSGMMMLMQSEDSILTTIEKDEQSYEIAKNNFKEVGLIDRVVLKNGDCIEILPSINQKFDFIFLDGPKGQYIKYLPFLIEMLNTGGVLFADNVLYRGMVNGKTPIAKSKKTLVKNLQLFLEAVTHDERLKSEILETEDGISISTKIKG